MSRNDYCWKIDRDKRFSDLTIRGEIEWHPGQPLSEIGIPCQVPEKSFVGLPPQYLKTDSLLYEAVLNRLIDENHTNLTQAWLKMGGWESYGVRSASYRNYLPVT